MSPQGEIIQARQQFLCTSTIVAEKVVIGYLRTRLSKYTDSSCRVRECRKEAAVKDLWIVPRETAEFGELQTRMFSRWLATTA